MRVQVSIRLASRWWATGALDGIRTRDLPLRRRTLYPLSYERVAVASSTDCILPASQHAAATILER